MIPRSPDARAAAARTLLSDTARQAADFIASRDSARVHDNSRQAAFSAWLNAFDFAAPCDPSMVSKDIFDWLGHHAVRSDHRRYFGLFNPPALPEAMAGDIIAAAVNPQLAVHDHAPAAAAIERHLLCFFGRCIGWRDDEIAGSFTSGGSEANHTALLAALARRYPDWARDGVRAMSRTPAIYVSAQAHLAWIKIARAAGLGSDAVCLVPTADGLSLRGEELAMALAAAPDRDPVLVVATAGTTAHGAIDDLPGLISVARGHGAHVHVDAAWAGAALLMQEGRHWMHGIDQADSVTIDAHKWLAVPMGAGMYLSRDWAPLEAAFAVDTGYMPSASLTRRDAYIHSLQWSRRFIGLKLFMALASLGQDGYEQLLRRQITLGACLRHGLIKRGWSIVNDTPLPLACFVPAGSGDDGAVHRISAAVVASGQAWISTVTLKGRSVLRACITSYETRESDIDLLLDLLDDARGADRA